jgi:hypothetical protein
MPAGVVRPVPHRALARRRRGLARLAGAAAVALLAACSPLVRDAPFSGARDHVADVALTGPFNGQIVDGTTNAPIGDATVVAVWSYDRGNGLVGPAGSETYVARSDHAGHYRVPEAPAKLRGQALRLVDFTLFVYKRGYVGYRSDLPYDGGLRAEFVARHNRVEMRKWAATDSHASHLLMLSPPPEIERLTQWERSPANAALLRALSGAPDEPGTPTTPAALEWLDASALLPPEEVRRRTGYLEAFDVGEFADLARTHFYHGVHLRAVDKDEVWDLGIRVWRNPPGGLEPVLETFRATLPGVAPTADITAETYVLDTQSVRAVAFLDRGRSVGVLLTCGAMQCADIETALILAGYVRDHLDDLRQVPVTEAKPVDGAAVPRATPGRP